MPIPPIVDRSLQRPDFDVFLQKRSPARSVTSPDISEALSPSTVAGQQADPYDEWIRKSLGVSKPDDVNTAIPVPVRQIDTSGRYDYFLLGEDNEDIAASGQPWYNKAANAIAKGVTLAGTTFAQGTAGLVIGLGKWLETGKFSSFYNNEFNQALDDFNQYLDNEVLPNYYSKTETNAEWYSPDNLLTANFLFDKVIKNLGFALGAAGSGAVYSKAINAVTSASKLFSIGRAMEVATEAEKLVTSAGTNLQRIAAAEKNLAAINQKLLGKYNVLTTGHRAVVAGLSTVGEAGMESLQNLNQFRQSQIQAFYDEHGYMPTGADLQAINHAAEQVGNASFLLNTALLTATNYVQFPRILGNSYKAGKSIANDFALKTKAFGREAVGAEYAVPKFTKLSKALSKGKYLFNPVEAFEEASQYAIQTGTQHYFDKKNTDSDFLSSVFEGYKEVFSTKEGWENLLLGGLSGAIMTFRGTRRENQALTRSTSAAIESFNANPFSTFMSEIKQGVDRGINIQQQWQEAVRQGDIIEAKDLERDYAHNYLTPRIKYGRFDQVKEDIEDSRRTAMTEDGFALLQLEGKASELDNRETFLNRLDAFEAHAQHMQTMYESLNLRFKGQTYEDGSRIYPDDVIDKMVYAASKVADYDRRIPQVMKELMETGVNLSAFSNSLIDAPEADEQVLYDVLNQIDQLPALSTTKEDMREALSDYIEMGKRRKLFLDEYSEMRDNPKKWTEPTPTITGAVPPTEEQPATIKVTTKDGEKELTIGEEYYLGRVVQHTKEGKEVYRFPRFTVLGQNADGTIKIKASNGAIRDINAGVLESYKLGKVSDVKNNKKAAFYLVNINNIFEYNFGEDKGGKQPGRLQYNSKKNKLYFVFRDKKGRLATKEVFGKNFEAQKGYKEALITKIGTVTADEQTYLNQFVNDADNRLETLREQQREALAELVRNTSDRLKTIDEVITKNKEELQKIEKDLAQLTNKIETATADKKGNFKISTRAALQNATRLSRMKDSLEQENIALEAEKQDLEMSQAYTENLISALDDLPVHPDDFADELKEQLEDTEGLIKLTGESINKLGNLIGEIEKSLDSFVELGSKLIRDFEKAYPKAPFDSRSQQFVDFLKANPNFLKLKPNYKQDLEQLQRRLTDIEDIDILPQEKELRELKAQLEPLLKDLDSLEKEYRARDIVYQKWAAIAAEQQKKLEAKEAFEKNKSLQEKIFKSQAKAQKDSGDTITNDPIEKNTVDDSARKSLETLFQSSIAPSENLKPHQVREQQLLNRARNLENREKLRTVMVTVHTEDALGLTGLTNLLLEGPQINATDPKTGPIALVYIEEDGTDRYFVNEKGERVHKVGEMDSRIVVSEDTEGTQIGDERVYLAQVPLTQIVFSVLPTASLTWANGQPRYAKGTKEQAEEFSRAWQAEREKIFSMRGDQVRINPFVISRGHALKNEEHEQNPIVGTLVSQQDLDLQGLVQVSTGAIDYRAGTDLAITIPVPAGRPLIMKDDLLQWADNRNFTRQEAETLFTILKQFVKEAQSTGNLNPAIVSYLQGVLYFGSPAEGKKAARNQIWFASGKLHLGNQGEAVGFTEFGMEDNKETVIAYLTGAYNNINKSKLAKKDPFTEITGVNADGSLKTRVWKSYQHFLLSPTIVQAADQQTEENGKPREGLPMLTTSVRKLTGQDDYNFEQKYVTLVGEVFDAPKILRPAAEKPVAKQATQEQKPQVKGQVDLAALKEKVLSTADLTPIMNDIFKVIDEKEYQKFQESVDEMQLYDELTPIIESLGRQPSENELANLVSKILLPRFLDQKIAQSSAKSEVKQGAFVLDGKTVNTHKFKSGEVTFVAAVEEGKVALKSVDSIEAAVNASLSPQIMKSINEYLQAAGQFDPAEGDVRKAQKAFAIQIAQLAQQQVGTSVEPGSAAPATVPQTPSPVVQSTAESALDKEIAEAIAKAKAEAISGTAIDPLSHRLATVPDYEIADLEAEQAWFEERFNIPFHRFTNLVEQGDSYSLGYFKDAAVYLWENAEVGTTYHEAFEAVWAMFTSPTERQKLLQEFRDREGTFTDRETGIHLQYSKASDHQAKEQMAEEFREKVLYDTNPPKSRSRGNFIQRLFSDLINFIRKIVLGEVSSLSDVFNRINAGKYKGAASLYSTYGDAQHRIKGFNEHLSNQIVKGVTAQVFSQLFADERSLVEFDENHYPVNDVYDKVRASLKDYYENQLPKLVVSKEITSQQFAKYFKLWRAIEANWGEVTKATNDFIRTFGVAVRQEGLQEFLVVDEDRLVGAERETDDNYSQREYEVEMFTFDHKKNASASVRLLFSTLVETIREAQNKVISLSQNSNGLPKPIVLRDAETKMAILVNYSKAFIHVMRELAPYNTLQEKKAKLNELTKSFPNYVKLKERLGFDRENLTMDQYHLQVRFFNVMSKVSPLALINQITDTGESHTISANLNGAARIQAQKWLDALKLKSLDSKSPVYVDKDRTYKLDTSILQSFNIGNLDGKLAFLKSLGIDFSKAMYNQLSGGRLGGDKNRFNENVSALHRHMLEAGGLSSRSARSLGVDGRLTKIAELYIKSQGEDYESTYINLKGEKVQQDTQTNYLSVTTNDINNSTSLQNLYTVLPHLSGGYHQGSIYLREDSYLFDEKGNKQSQGFQVAYIQGTLDQRKTSNPAIPTENLSRGQRLLQEINQNLQGNYYVLVPADSKTEWMLQMHNYVSLEEVINGTDGWNKIYRVFNRYYQVEKELYADDKKPRLLASLSNQYSEDSINAAIRQFIEDRVQAQKARLREYGILTAVGQDQFVLGGLDSNFLTTNFKGQALSEKNVDDILRYRTANWMINNTELHKLFFGDPAMYKDPTKRYKSFLSGREVSMHSSPEFNNTLAKHYNQGLTERDPGYWVFTDTMYAAVLDDISTINEALANNENLPEDIRKAYSDVTSTDSQSWASLPGYREIWLRAGRWLSAHEQQFQYLMAADRLAMEEDGLYTYTSTSLKEKDQTLVKKGNPHSAYFPVLKPIGTGINGDNNPFLHKTSVVPLWYTAVRKTNLSNLYQQMLKQKITYAIVGSAEKVGNTGMANFYNEDGSYKEGKFSGEHIREIPFKYYGIQVETNSKKDSQTRGSQATKLATVNLMDAGVPVDERAGKEIAYNTELLRKLTRLGYDNLLNKLGIIDNGTSYRIEDKKLVAKLLQDELLKREVADNIRQALQINGQTGDFNTALEAMPNYGQIKSVLYSFVDKSITSPKYNGGPKVQVSGALWEQKGIRKAVQKNGKTVYVSNNLKFYNPRYNEAGEIIGVGRMQVYLPSWISAKLRKKGFDFSDEELIKKMTPEMLRGIGFRIPTQELNSIDSFEVKGFLPEEMGDTIVVPEELVAKAGSDFDVDKLSTYLPNIHVKNTGELHLVEYQGSNEATLDYYRKFYDDALKVAKKKQERKIENTARLFSLVQSFDLGLMSEEEIAKHAEVLDDVLEDQQSAEDFAARLMTSLERKGRTLERMNSEAIQAEIREYFAHKMLQRALENEYFASLDRLITHPKNFERLVTPNNSKVMLDIRKELNDLLGVATGTGTILDPLYLSDVRHNFIVGKGGVGIAAVQQTNNALNQRGVIYVDTDAISSFPEDESRWLGEGDIKLPHNTIEVDGKIVATLSRIKDRVGRFISDKISQYINGYVDISKDPFIVEVGANPNVASTYMLLEKLGVPTRTVIMFMNQPIIREFLKIVETSPFNWFFDERLVDAANSLFISDAEATHIQHEQLADNIRQYYKEGKKTFTQDKAAEQQLILKEFLKYAMMARHLFEFTQGSNYDTANFNDPNMIYIKELATNRALSKNIFSSVDTIFSQSFIGEVKQSLTKSREAIAQTLLEIEKPAVRQVINPTVERLWKTGLPTASLMKSVKKLEQSLLSYLVLVKTKLGGRVYDLLIEQKTATAKKIQQFLEKLPDNSDLRNNFFFKELSLLTTDTADSTKNLSLNGKISDAYTSNLVTGSLRELRDNPLTNDPKDSLYGRIIKTLFLQSGLTRSPISLTEYIPYEDYNKFILPAIQQLQDNTSYEEFSTLDAFYRNNWADPNIVPRIQEQRALDANTETWYTKNRLRLPFLNTLMKSYGMDPATSEYRGYIIDSRSRARRSRYVTIQVNKAGYTSAQIQAMKKKGDYSYKLTLLLRRVERPNGEPYEITYPGGKGKYTPYLPVNAWGDSFRGQEYYDHVRPSVYANNTLKVPREISDRDFIAAALGQQPQDAQFQEDPLASAKEVLQRAKKNGEITKKDCD